MPDPNVYQKVHDALDALAKFLTSQPYTGVKAMIVQMASRFPQIRVVVEKLCDLMDDFKVEIEKLDVGDALDNAPEFLETLSKLLASGEQMFPDQAADLQNVDKVVDEVGQVIPILSKTLTLILDIKKELDALKSALPPAPA
jgi:ABC-type transporter Mla subunit MlaD